MSTETNQNEGTAEIVPNEEAEQAEELLSIPKKDYENMNQTIGSLKRELKDAKKAKEYSKEPSQDKAEESALLLKLEKMSLRQAGLTHDEDIELARKTAKKWNMDLDDVLADDDFKAKLERQQTNRSNSEATANIRGGAGPTQAKNTTAYWQAKGAPPTPDQVPDRKTRSKITREMMKNAETGGKTFYND